MRRALYYWKSSSCRRSQTTRSTRSWDARGRVYLNFLGDEGAEGVRQAYGDRQYERLVELKRAYDPTNLFRLNQNIEP